MTKIIGLTGGIGSGKSTVAKFFLANDIPVYIADEAAKKIMQEPSIINEIQKIFEENVLLKSKQLDRKKIAKIVFSDPAKLQALNNIIHPRVKQDFINWLELHQSYKFIIKEVAILFETNGDKDCHKIILVTAPEKVRIERVMKRDSEDEKSVKNRIKNQLSDDEKREKSDFIIDNLDLESTERQVKNIIKKLKKMQ